MQSIALKQAASISIDAVVRSLPGRRDVLRGMWGNKPVYVKKFIGGSASRYFHRDLAGVELLLKSGIVTPTLLHHGLTSDESAYVLIFSEIENAKNIEQIWPDLEALERLSLAHRLVETIAEHHRAGLMQTDLYFKNFLLCNETVYTLDGDGIRRLPRLLSRREMALNLATLFSKMDVLDDAWVPTLYRHYCTHLNILYSQADMERLCHFVQKIRRRDITNYADKKVFRTCSDVKVESSCRSYRAVADGFLLQQSALALDVFLTDAKSNLKNGNTCTVGLAQLAEHQVVIKRYNIKNWWHALMRALRPSRAAVSWANAHRLMISNIATPRPLALIEERWGCLRGRAYFLSAYVDAPDVAKFYVQNTDAEIKQTVAQNLATLFFKLYALQYAHGDCKASNIKIVNDQPMLIDLDSMCAYRPSWIGGWRFARAHVKDLKRFMKNWQDDAPTLALFKQAFQSTYPKAAKPILIRAGIL